MPAFTRRQLIQTAFAASAGVTWTRLAAGEGEAVSETPAGMERHLELHNTHTNETVSVVYRIGDEFQPRALESLRHVMRDHRNNMAHDIDLPLYDQLHDLAVAAKCEPRFEIISG